MRLPMICILMLTACSAGITSPAARSREFERRLDALRVQYNVPGMSGIVDGADGTVWERAYGLANVETQDSVTPATMFHLASLTKPFAAVIALQLEEEGLLDMNAPAARYGINIAGTDTVRIWHLLSHTSESQPPGGAYRYNGNRYAMVEPALTTVSGQSFAQLYQRRIKDVLGLESTVPNPRAPAAYAGTGLDVAPFAARLAQGYAFSMTGGAPVRVVYEPRFNPAAGMISTPRDVVRFSRALDEGRLVSAAARARMWTPVRTSRGAALPYALGWFVQEYHGETLIWHYGLWVGASALIIKVPARRLTFVLLANSPGLNQSFPLGDGDLKTSPFAMLFLKTFIDGNGAP